MATDPAVSSELTPRSSSEVATSPDSLGAEHTMAAVDLGSNSFHLLVAKVHEGDLHVIDRLREPVRLAAGLDAQRILSDEATKRGLECLKRFRQRLGDLPGRSIRAVGTNTLRSARNGEAFRRAAETTLGHPIDVIAGREEARLIYLGVAHSLAGDRGRRLVVDIGGGSTEFVVGEDYSPIHRESLYMGCVSMSRRYFSQGLISKSKMRAAELAARVELEPIEERFRNAGWQIAIGCSGTVKAVAAIVNTAGWCNHGITRDALRQLRRALIDAGQVEALKIRGLREERRGVFPGGVAVLQATFDALGIEEMEVSHMALREGLLYDLVGRIRHEDVRDATVRKLSARYTVDRDQAVRVEATALLCFDQVSARWGLGAQEPRKLLGWAARLHEVGLVVSHNQYHKHGAYILEHGDMAGFSRQEQALLAALVRGHRRKFPSAVFAEYPTAVRKRLRALGVLLRLAVLLHRARVAAAPPIVNIRAHEKSIHIVFPAQWLDQHPLTRADLIEEAEFLKAAGYTLGFS